MSFRDWIDRTMLAVTFAEANEHETAKKLLKKKTLYKRVVKRVRQRLRLEAPNYRKRR